MSYIPIDWVQHKTPINETNLDRMENGILEAHEAISAVNEAITETNSKVEQIARNQIPEEYLQKAVDDFISENESGLVTKTELNTLDSKLTGEIADISAISKNLFDGNYIGNTYIQPYGTQYPSDAYNALFMSISDDIKGKTLFFSIDNKISVKARFVGVESVVDGVTSWNTELGAENVNSITVPTNTNRIALTFAKQFVPDMSKLQVEIDEITTFIPYGKRVVKSEEYEERLTECEEKIAILEDTSTHVQTVRGNLTGNVVFSTAQNAIKNNKHVAFTCNISSMGELWLGHGFTDYNSKYFVINDTQIALYSYSDKADLIEVKEHNLTITNNLQVLLDIDVMCKATITVVSNGERFIASFDGFDNPQSAIMVKGVNSSFTDCVFSFTCNGYSKDIQLYGDSYLGITNENRWAHYLASEGYSDNVLVDGFSGRNTETAYTSLINNLTFSKPKFIVWALGMNDADSNTEINNSWKTNTENMIAICKERGITPILATIPTVNGAGSKRNHSFKNQYVKNSGYRYIDFEKAVGADSNGNWYGDMLSTDGVHPNKSGAIALYAQALCDFPEFMC